MGLFILTVICILVYTFKNDLLKSLKDVKKHNEKVTKEIECGNSWYSEKDYHSIVEPIGEWIFDNLTFSFFGFLAVGLISFFVFIACDVNFEAEREYSFRINSLKDNLVTEGEFHRRIYSTHGSIDGEISYFFSRTMEHGEKIGHIPASKTYVKYDDNRTPCIEVHQTYADIPEWLDKIFFLECFNEPTVDYYVIVVPDGSIITEGVYEIDME